MHEFSCAACGRRFVTASDQTTQNDEALRLWGKPITDPDMEEVCDDCFQEVMKWLRQREATTKS